ncbi:MAG: hypothetical protein V1731_00435 [Candidatus Aenigmatarchaeota archaeon]
MLLNFSGMNRLEKCYSLLFAFSLLAGIAYGLFDNDYFKCCEGSIGVPEEGTSVLRIFSGNYLLSLSEFFTVGLSSIYFNFHTLSVTSSYLNSTGSLVTLPIILFIAFFELCGSLLIALSGLSILERLFGAQSKLKPKELFVYGTALVFVGAIVEYLILAAFA